MVTNLLLLISHVCPILDWLVDRRHCNVKWHQQLRQIRENIVQHLTVLPENTIEAVSELKDNESVLSVYLLHLIVHLLITSGSTLYSE